MKIDLDKRVQKLGYSSYKKYLQSSHWLAVKARFFKSKLIKRNNLDEPCCSFCGSNFKLHVHHKSYNSLGKEKLMHLELLCEICHSFVHEYCNKNLLDLWRGTKKAGSIIKKSLKEKIVLVDYNSLKMPKHTRINFGTKPQLVKRNG